jgi:hypothetical protein
LGSKAIDIRLPDANPCRLLSQLTSTCANIHSFKLFNQRPMDPELALGIDAMVG